MLSCKIEHSKAAAAIPF